MFLGKGVLKICIKFTEEHLCRSVLSIKLLCFTLAGCSSVSLLHIFRSSFYKNTYRELLLTGPSFVLRISGLYWEGLFTLFSNYPCHQQWGSGSNLYVNILIGRRALSLRQISTALKDKGPFLNINSFCFLNSETFLVTKRFTKADLHSCSRKKDRQKNL